MPNSLWLCPRCGHRFTSRNLSHSCGRYRLRDHSEGRPALVRAIFARWRAAAKACGPVTVYAEKTRIVFQARVRFGGAVVRRDWIDAHLWLTRRVDHPRVHRVESLGRLGCAVHFRLAAPEHVDAALEALVREAYELHGRIPTSSAPSPSRAGSRP